MSNGVGSFIWMLDDQIFYLVFNATFSYIVVKYFIWCLTPLSVISCSSGHITPSSSSSHTHLPQSRAANCWRSDGFWIWKIQVQGSSPIGWNCRRFSLVPFYRINRIKKEAASDWFFGLIDRFFRWETLPLVNLELFLWI